MEMTAIISAVLKLGIALIPVFFYWLGYSRGKKSGYAKGVNDERVRSEDAINELLKKNLDVISNPNSGMSVAKLHPKVSENPH